MKLLGIFLNTKNGIYLFPTESNFDWVQVFCTEYIFVLNLDDDLDGNTSSFNQLCLFLSRNKNIHRSIVQYSVSTYWRFGFFPSFFPFIYFSHFHMVAGFLRYSTTNRTILSLVTDSIAAWSWRAGNITLLCIFNASCVYLYFSILRFVYCKCLVSCFLFLISFCSFLLKDNCCCYCSCVLSFPT